MKKKSLYKSNNQEGECCYCDDPKGDLICEKCADEIYGEEDEDDNFSIRTGLIFALLIFISGVAIGYAWALWVTSVMR